MLAFSIPTRMRCDVFSDKETCQIMGCDWKNKRGARVGRKEKKLLKELKVEIGTVAKDAILAEYGDMYSVQIIEAPEDFILNKHGAVKRVPNFG